ncbi:MAG: magnesium transporter [Candidatus Diapherotrites archaeon]
MKLKIIDNNLIEIMASQAISVGGGLIAGTILATQIDKIFLIPGMLILVPGLLEIRGSISGTFASRLTSGMFLKIINPKKPNKKIMIGNIIATFVLAIISSLVLGTIATIGTLLITNELHIELIAIAIIASFLANIIEIPLAIAVTFYLFEKGHDPNNIIGPFITTTGDITSIACLLIAMMII